MIDRDIINWLVAQSKIRNTNGFIVSDVCNKVQTRLAFLLAKQTMQSVEIFDINTILCEHTKYSNKLVIAPYDIMELNYIRPWNRFGLAADLFPFGNMYRQDIHELFLSFVNMDKEGDVYLGKHNDDCKYSEEIPFTLDELKWAHESNKRYDNILSGDKDPSKNTRWFSLTSDQKKVIAKLHQHSKLTKHKMTTTGIVYDV